VTDTWQTQREALGAFIRAQRQLANLSLRQLAERTSLSNPYTTAADAAETGDDERTEAAISADKRLSDDQKAALIAVYRSMIDRP
jgi:transcriptional regulator with XRE-family HTH domain